MENTELTALVSEMRAEFQIPPYYEDSQLANLAREGECTVGSLNPGCNITTDLTYRMLLKITCIMHIIIESVSLWIIIQV